MKTTVYNITHPITASLSSLTGETTITYVDWGEHRFAVEVSKQGVRVYEVHASGDKENQRIEEQGREVWIDPHEMTNELQRRNVLMVHGYVAQDENGQNGEGVPVTLSLDACEIVLTNDGKGTLLANEGINVTEKKT